MQAAARWGTFLLLLGGFVFGVWWWQPDRTHPARQAVAPRDGRGSSSTPPAGPELTGSPSTDVQRTQNGAAEPTVFLAPDAMVHGVVLFADSSRPVRGGLVEIVLLDAIALGDASTAVQSWPETRKAHREITEAAPIDPQGRFELALPVGAVLRRARVRPSGTPEPLRAGFLTTERDLGDRILTANGETLDLRVREGCSVSGVVRDADSGAPIENARVLAVDWSVDQSDRGARTDDRGEFRIGGLTPETLHAADTLDLRAEHDDYVATRVSVPVAAGVEAVTQVEIALRRGVVLAGTVVDEAGQPRRGAELHLYQFAGSPGPIGQALEQHVTTRAGADGAFRFPPVRPASSFELMGVHDAAVITVLHELDARRSVTDRRVVLPSGVRVDVRARAPGTNEDLAIERCEAVLTDGGVAVQATHTARDGRHTLEVRTAPGAPRMLEVGAILEDDTTRTYLFGATTLFPATSAGDAATPVEVTLQAVDPPPPGLRMLNATRYFGFDLTFHFHEEVREPAMPGPTIVSVASPPLRLNASPDPLGRLRLRIGAGRHFLDVRSPGRVPVQFVLDAGGRGHVDFPILLHVTNETTSATSPR